MNKQQLEKLKQLRIDLEELMKEFTYLKYFFVELISEDLNGDSFDDVSWAYTNLVIAEKVEKGELEVNNADLNKLISELEKQIDNFTYYMNELLESVQSHLNYLEDELTETTDETKYLISNIDLPDNIKITALETIERTDKALSLIGKIKNGNENINYAQINDLIYEIKDLIYMHKDLQRAIKTGV
jgi:hypothetical protein